MAGVCATGIATRSMCSGRAWSCLCDVVTIHTLLCWNVGRRTLTTTMPSTTAPILPIRLMASSSRTSASASPAATGRAASAAAAAATAAPSSPPVASSRSAATSRMAASVPPVASSSLADALLLDAASDSLDASASSAAHCLCTQHILVLLRTCGDVPANYHNSGASARTKIERCALRRSTGRLASSAHVRMAGTLWAKERLRVTVDKVVNKSHARMLAGAPRSRPWRCAHRRRQRQF